jgi:hypothetical protein
MQTQRRGADLVAQMAVEILRTSFGCPMISTGSTGPLLWGRVREPSAWSTSLMKLGSGELQDLSRVIPSTPTMGRGHLSIW